MIAKIQSKALQSNYDHFELHRDIGSFFEGFLNTDFTGLQVRNLKQQLRDLKPHVSHLLIGHLRNLIEETIEEMDELTDPDETPGFK